MFDIKLQIVCTVIALKNNSNMVHLIENKYILRNVNVPRNRPGGDTPPFYQGLP
jgi:hypothetical protein